LKRGNTALPMRPVDWAALILDQQVFRGKVYAERDCAGKPIRWEPPPATCAVKSPWLDQPEPVPLLTNSVFERKLPDGRRLVWVITHRFDNGEGFGPIALTRTLDTGVEVESLGTLRLRTDRVSLELWQIAGQPVVVAGGETCLHRNDPATCRRAVNVLVYHDQALLSPPVSYRNGHCIDEPWTELKREEDLALDSGWNRHFEITSSVSHDQRYLVITEQVVVDDSDPDAPDVPPREVRRIDTQRFIHVIDGRLITRQHPLWPRILPSAGSTELTSPAGL